MIKRSFTGKKNSPDFHHFFEVNLETLAPTYRLMCTSKATPVSRSRGWCSMRTIVSRKVTLIRRRTAHTDEMRDMQSFIRTDLSTHLSLVVSVCSVWFFDSRNIPTNLVRKFLMYAHCPLFTK